MTNPWNGPRHRSWASDTVVFAVIFVIILFTTVLVAQLSHQPPPTYLQGLLGASSAALFGAVGSDKSKREREISDEQLIARLRATDISEVADRADAKADKLADLARSEHPGHAELNRPPITDHGREGGPSDNDS